MPLSNWTDALFFLGHNTTERKLGLTMAQARKRESEGENGRTITVEAAAKELGISRSSAYEAAHRGEIPAIVIGRRVLVLRRGLDDILEGRAPGSVREQS